MASVDDLLRSDLVKGVALGVGAALLIPVAATALAPVLRPMGRTALKAGVLAFERARETAAELGEMVEDMMAEAQTELRAAREDTAVAAGAAAADGAASDAQGAAGEQPPESAADPGGQTPPDKRAANEDSAA